jgi:hypothetical protein
LSRSSQESAYVRIDFLPASACLVDGDKVKVDGANVAMSGMGASNGVIHVIDTVLLPR